MGLLYQAGQGVPQDFTLAHMWLNLAAAQGDSDAQKRRDELTEKMTPAQIADAQRLAREWKPKDRD
jgi:TPR repeat protein